MANMKKLSKLSNYTHARYCCDISDLTPDERRAHPTLTKRTDNRSINKGAGIHPAPTTNKNHGNKEYKKRQ